MTGSRGFVGRWVLEDLAAHGHEPIDVGDRSRFDILDPTSVDDCVRRSAPDAIVHLAAVSTGHAATKDPARALAVNVGGTIAILEAVRRRERPPAVLISGSAEVYGWPPPSELPLHETSRIAPRGVYATTKAAQEGVAIAFAQRFGLRLVVTRSFHHAGPGQREPLALASFAHRVLAVAQGSATVIPVGDIDVARDLLDVRDVAAAYRQLVEWLVAPGMGRRHDVVNVASGRAVVLRELVEHLCRLAGIEPVVAVQSELLRPGEPREITGDPSRLQQMTAWQPTRDVFSMVTDMWNEVAGTGRSDH